MFRENLGLPRYFKMQRFCLKAIGISFTNEDKIVTNYFLASMTITAKLFLLIRTSLFAFQHFNDVDVVTEALGPIWQNLLSVFKWFIFMYKRRELRHLFRLIWGWNLEATKAERAIIVKENESDILFNRVYLTFVSITGVLAVTKQLLIDLAIWAHTGEFHLLPPLKAAYPLDIHNPYYYFIQIIWDFLGVYAIIYTSVGVDGLFSWISRNVIAQFCILHILLEQTASQHNGKASKQSIIACIKYHNRILDIVDKLNDVLGLIIFAKFTISCLQICVLAYQLTQVRNIADIIFLATFLLAVALQLFIYCYLGQRIQDESTNVAEYVYDEFKWQKVDVASRKLLLMPMKRAQRSSSLTGIFFVVDFALYLWVFTTASSYITLLLSLEE